MTSEWKRVAAAVRARRHELGINQASVAGVSASTWSKLENARQSSYKPFVLARVEQALHWSAGTIQAIRDGAADSDRTGSEGSSSRLDAIERRLEELERIVEKLAEERRAI
jgi:transcriptional regulator with XRE-family HTH domain